MLNRSRLLIGAFFSLALVISLALPALPAQDIILTYSDSGYTTPATTFGDGDTVYVEVTDNTTTGGGALTISVNNVQDANSILVSVTEGATYIYRGSFTITSGAGTATALRMQHGQTANIVANLDGDNNSATEQITADYGITQLLDIIWTYSNSGYTVEATEFGDGDTVYVKVSDSQTSGGTKAITVANNTIGNSISVNITDSNSDSFYLGSFIIHSAANDDTNDKLTLFDGQAATITADVGGDGLSGTKNITASYGVTPLTDNIWTYSNSGYTVEATEFGDGDTVYLKVTDTETTGGTKTATVVNNDKGNSISVNITDSNSDSFYLGTFIIHSAANDDTNDKLALFYGESATITADVGGDGAVGSETIYAAYTTPPPTDLKATAIAGGSVLLTWIPSSPETNVSQYNIYRAIVSGEQNPASPLASVPPGTDTYTDNATTHGITYYYVVRSLNRGGSPENNTNEAIATTDAVPPPSPSNLTAAPISGDGIQLTWAVSSPETDVFQYNIYRATSSGSQDFTSPTYTVSVGITSYTDSSAIPGQTYYYVVRAQDAAGNADSNTNEAWTTAGFASSIDQIYTSYQDSLLCNLITSTDRSNPSAFTNGKIDEIYLKVNLLGAASLNESSSSIALYKLVNNTSEEVPGSQQVNQGTGWAELSLYLDSEFDPDADGLERNGLYWVDITVVDMAANSENYDFYFVYDTTSPSTPSFGITSFDPTVGRVTVSGTTVPDELSDPQTVEIFVNGISQGTVAADANYQFVGRYIPLASGTNRIQAQSMDKAGNKSEMSESLNIDWNPQGLTVFRSVHVVKSGSSIDIIYSVAQPAQITIRIFNLLGEIVKEWQGSVSANTENQWTWHGRNMYEQEVNNGVYICTISATHSSGSSEEITKLLAVVR